MEQLLGSSLVLAMLIASSQISLVTQYHLWQLDIQNSPDSGKELFHPVPEKSALSVNATKEESPYTPSLVEGDRLPFQLLQSIISSIGHSRYCQTRTVTKTITLIFTVPTTGTSPSFPCLSRTKPGPAAYSSPVSSEPTQRLSNTVTPVPTAPDIITTATMSTQDIFSPISTAPVPSNIIHRGDHPVPKLGLNATGPVPTNKFYANVFLGSQTCPTFTHPYSVSWSKGGGDSPSYGMVVSNIDADKLALGEPNNSLPGSPVRYYINPVGIKSIILSAVEFGESTVLTTDKPLAFSAHVHLQPQAGSQAKVTFPLVQGMGYVTGIYRGLQPAIESRVFFRGVESAASPREGIFKYRATLEDGKIWLVYVTPDNGANPNLQLVSNGLLRGPAGFNGTIQVAKNPSSSTEAFYDGSAGVYATEGTVSGSVSSADSTGTYNLSWKKAGKNVDATPLLMFALPHHVQSFDSSTSDRKTPITLRTTTKGMATGVVGESWTMVEPNLPKEMGFAPWSSASGSVGELSPAALQVIRGAAPSELSQDMLTQTDLDSMYFSGKALSKFATLVYTIHELARDPSMAANALATLKTCFARFVDNTQKYPLVYDDVWKGVVSSGTYETGDSGLDFGNTYYNDHHFHFGYFVHAAAVIGHVDPSWVNPNKEWVNMLIRDAANSIATDESFPFSRGFDWYHGHSWAKGLFESLDGKDEESTSEDTMFAYAIKMWGKITGDASMEARGNLMLGILARTLDNYFLMSSTNTNQPPQFIDNKVTGILFENKVDHTTYFGANLEYIQGIHMLPLLPNSAYTRKAGFVTEEWNAMFAPGAAMPANQVQGGWRGVLFSNLAIIDPAAAWDFFAQPNFDMGWIDGGTTRTWSLAYAAGLGGGPA